jgi:hypothetical protein
MPLRWVVYADDSEGVAQVSENESSWGGYHPGIGAGNERQLRPRNRTLQPSSSLCLEVIIRVTGS